MAPRGQQQQQPRQRRSRRTNSSQTQQTSPDTTTATVEKDGSSDDEPAKVQPRQSPSSKPQKKKTTTINSSNKANTGGIRNLPLVQPPNELHSRALRRVHNQIRDDTSIKNARARARKRGAETLDLLAKELCLPLRDVVDGYRRVIRKLHPFEGVVVDLTVRARAKKDGLTLDDVLTELHEARKEILQLSRDYIAQIKSQPTAREAFDTTALGVDALASTYLELASAPLEGLMSLQKGLRSVPAVRLDSPAVVLVGAPNVGKSSIVRSISSGTPEVNNYPFTTRGMTLGHVRVFWEEDDIDGEEDDIAEEETEGKGKEGGAGRVVGSSIPTPREVTRHEMSGYTNNNKSDASGKGGGSGKATLKGRRGEDEVSREDRQRYAFSQLCQIMDSPGLLNRKDGGGDNNRNEMEALTLAAMAHLPTAVMYVMDLSGGAGDACSSVEDQLLLRREVRTRFPRRPWVDVVAKYDLGVVDGAEERLRELREAEGAAAPPLIELSVKEGTGVEDLRREVMRMLGEVRVVLDAMAAIDGRSARPSSSSGNS